MSGKYLVVLFHKRGKDSLPVDILKVGKVTDDGGFLGEHPATQKAIDDFLRIVNESAHHIMHFSSPDRRYCKTAASLSDVVGKTRRVFVDDSGDIMLECQLTQTTNHRQVGFVINTEMSSRELAAEILKVTNVESIHYFVQFSDNGEL